MGADLGVASITGHFHFDALVIFAPHFMFMIDLGIGLTVRAFGVTLCGVNIELHLEGPAPWRAEGSAEVEILWWDVDIDVGPFTWGDDDNPPPEPIDARQLVFDAIDHKPGAWAALTPPGTDQLVTTACRPSRATPPSPSIRSGCSRCGSTPCRWRPRSSGSAPTRCPAASSGSTSASRRPAPSPSPGVSEVTDLFSAGNFLNLTDDQKMSRPSFEPMPAGRPDPAARRSRPRGPPPGRPS